MMSDVARKILMKDPAADDQRKKDKAGAKLGGGRYGGTANQRDLKVLPAAASLAYSNKLYAVHKHPTIIFRFSLLSV